MAEKNINCEVELSDDLDTEPAVEQVAELNEPTPESEPAEPVEPEIGRDLCRMKLCSVKYSNFEPNEIAAILNVAPPKPEIENELGGVKSCPYFHTNPQVDHTYGGYRQDILTENLTERDKAVLICKKCKGIMKEASISERGEQFCSCCCVYGRKTPNSSVREMISSLKCSCPLIERGCQWFGTLEDCENHLDTCGYVHETCRLKCGIVLRREEFGRHEKENCLERQVKCEHCYENFKSRKLNRHHDKCPKIKVLCDLCGTKITRDKTARHLKHDCGMVQVTCKLGCEKKLTRNKLVIHEKENCTQRVVKCDHCDKNFKSLKLKGHQEKCPKMKVSCDLCDTKMTREEMELHLKHDCGMVQETCKLGCGMEVTRNKLGIHENENCLHRLIQCEHCFIDVIFCNNSKHLKECPLVTVTCYLCSEEKYRKEMTQHLRDDCPEKTIDCPFVKYKCLAIMKRKDIDKHLEEKETKHLGLKLTAMEYWINKQSEIINKQSEEIKKLNENIREQNKETTTEISNTSSQQIKLLYFITDTTKIIWKVKNVQYSIDFSSTSKQYEVVGYWLAFKFHNYRRLSIIFPGSTTKPDRPFIAKCRIMLQSCYTINCGMIEVKQKDVTRGYEGVITSFSQEDIKKYSEPQFPGSVMKDLTLEIFITMQ